MGSKKLKAVYATGKKKPTLFDGPGLKASIKELRADMMAATKGLHDYSTAGGLEAVEYHGDLPVKNWQLGSWKAGARAISAQTFMAMYPTKHGTCNMCPVRCHKQVELPDGEYPATIGHSPEYETLAGFGSNLLIDKPEAIIIANEICNRLGIDTISTAGLVAFAFEAYEKGLVDSSDTGGLELVWGCGHAMIELVRSIGLRTDLGRVLGEGSRRAAATIGQGSESFIMEVKGLEMPFHDPRAHVSMAPNYATASRGACHLDSLSYFIGRGVPAPDLGYTEAFADHDSTPEMAELCYTTQNYMSMFNPLGYCKFLFVGRIGPTPLADWYRLATGNDMDRDAFMEMGERIIQLKRLYNVKLGVRRIDDRLPTRLENEAQPDGKAAGVLPNTELMLDALYKLRGWDHDGVPTLETCRRFGLEEFAPNA
jgi:aldehyde:ferredoxin oxidoreductase